MTYWTRFLMSSLLVSAPSLAKTTVRQHWAIAQDHFEKRAYLEGAEQLQKLVDDYPNHFEARPIGAWFFWEAAKHLSGPERSALEKRAESFILSGFKANETSWFYNREMGDFYRLRVGSNPKAYTYYKQAVDNFDSATNIQKAALLDRLARSAEELGRKGDAVTAACRALELDPDDKMAKGRIKNLAGNCKRKGINLELEGVNADAPEIPKTPEGSSH